MSIKVKNFIIYYLISIIGKDNLNGNNLSVAKNQHPHRLLHVLNDNKKYVKLHATISELKQRLFHILISRRT